MSTIYNKNGIKGFYVGQNIKYICRFDQKNEIEDLEKVRRIISKSLINCTNGLVFVKTNIYLSNWKEKRK